MKAIALSGWCTLFYFLCNSSILAQTNPKPIGEMSWEELTLEWQALAIDGKFAASVQYAQAALEKALRDSTENSPEYGNSLDILGYSLHHSGRYAEAERAFTAGVAHGLKYLGEDNEDYITRLSNLAMLHMDMGELAQSASELEKAVHLAEKNLGDDNPYVAIMVNNLGVAYDRIGNFDHALVYYLRALELTERTVGKENIRYGIRLSNIASVLRKLGKNEQALDFSLRALPIYEKTVGRNHPDYLSGINGLMSSYTSLGMYDKALPWCDTLLTLMVQVSNNESPETYDITACIANLYFRSHQYERCVEFSKKELARYSLIFPRLYSRHAFMALLVMVSLEKTGQLQEAAEFALLLNHFSLDELRENFSKFSEIEQQQQYQSYRQNPDIAFLLFALKHPEFPALAAAAYDYQMTIKGLSLSNRRQLFQSLRENSAAELTTQFEEWQGLENDISRQYALMPTQRPTNLDSLLERSNELERSLVLGSEPFRLASQSVRWQDVQGALLPGEAAIEFAEIQNDRNDSTFYVAWVIRSGDQTPKQVFLFEKKQLGNLGATRRLYSPAPSLEGKTLQELVWEPLKPLLDGISSLYFAPAGILHQVNFGAIPTSPTEVLASQFKLHRMVSTRLLVALNKSPEQITPASALVFGGIRYETDSLALLPTNAITSAQSGVSQSFQHRGNGLGNSWSFLSGSLQEAIGVRSQLEKRGTEVRFASGFDASEGFFKKTVQNTPSPAVLHLATHGFFLTTPDTNAHSGFAAAENPMARAGLVLSGANRVWNGGQPLAGQEDGILTALEISRLDLSGTELAVLSACGTGQGKIEAGEGVLGLQRAFKMAGVHYVIMTLWNVQDHDAQQFMGFFYDEWLSQKKSVPEAFRVAQQKMRLLHTKPFQPTAWAGFLLLE